MFQESFLELKARMNENNILLTFAGTLSQEIIEDLGAAIKNYLINDQTPTSNTHSVFAVYIEQTQNIKNYLSLKASQGASDEVINSGMVTIGKNEGKYFVYSGNMVEIADAQLLASRIEPLNRMNKDELKAAYKEQLKKARGSDCPSAGLGLIDMARKASAPIEYALVDHNADYQYFIIKVVI